MEISKAQIKKLKSLHQSKFRWEEKLFFVEGKKGVEELIKSEYELVYCYSTDEVWNKRFTQSTLIKEQEMHQISALSSPSAHFAVAKIKSFDVMDGKGKMLYLDGIRDPGNLGTIIRSADWFGWNNIICSHDCVDFTNPKVVQSTMGSLFNVRLQIDANGDFLSRAMEEEYEIWGADLNGENVKTTAPSDQSVLVIGSESHGIREEVEKWLTHKVNIDSKGKAESLNAAIAASIILFQWS